MAELLISNSVLSAIVAESTNAVPYEAKGLLHVHNGQIFYKPIRENLLEGRFEIDPEQVRSGHYIGCYDSHPKTSARLTGCDQQNIGKLGLKLWMVYSVPRKNYRFFWGQFGQYRTLLTKKRTGGVKLMC